MPTRDSAVSLICCVACFLGFLFPTCVDEISKPGENPGHCVVPKTFTAIVEMKEAKEVRYLVHKPKA